MISKIVSLRYARALEKVCQNKSLNLNDIYSALDDLCSILKDNNTIFELLKVSIYPIDRKFTIIDNLTNNLDIIDLLKFMVLNGRVELIFDTLESFKEIMMQRQNKAIGYVYSTLELTEEEKKALLEHFEKITGKNLEFEFLIDPKLLGGCLVEIDNKVYDGSIKTYLNNISSRLNSLSISQGGDG